MSSAEGVPVLVGDVASVELSAMPRQRRRHARRQGRDRCRHGHHAQGESGKVVADRVKSRMADIAASCRRA